MSQYLYEGSRVTPQAEDGDLVELEGLLGGFRHEAPLALPLPRRTRAPRWSQAVMLLAALALGGACLFSWGRAALEKHHPLTSAEPMSTIESIGTTEPMSTGSPCALGNAGFAFAAETGALHCAGVASSAGVWPVGQWLEAANGGVATVELADIGSLTVHGGTRLRLRETSANQHRIELATGAVSVRVVAPPRVFVVDTPAASAVDLGCAYDIQVDATGRTHLRVTSGAVSLEGQGRASWVPEGHEAVATVERGPGLPLLFDADRELREAALRFEAGHPLGLRDVLAQATERDVATLNAVLNRTTGAERSVVLERLEALRGAPVWQPQHGAPPTDATANVWR